MLAVFGVIVRIGEVMKSGCGTQQRERVAASLEFMSRNPRALQKHCQDHTLAQAGVAEMIFTFVLCYVVLATATIAKPESQRTNLGHV